MLLAVTDVPTDAAVPRPFQGFTGRDFILKRGSRCGKRGPFRSERSQALTVLFSVQTRPRGKWQEEGHTLCQAGATLMHTRWPVRHGADTGAPGDSPNRYLSYSPSQNEFLRQRAHPSSPGKKTTPPLGPREGGSDSGKLRPEFLRVPGSLSAGRPEDGASRTRDSKSSRTVLVLARQRHRRETRRRTASEHAQKGPGPFKVTPRRTPS